MPADPVLDFLLAAERSAAVAHEAARAAVCAYRGDASAQPEDEFLPLRDAAPLFGVREVTLRRDVTEKGMGKKEPGKNGRIWVNVTMVRKHRPVRCG